MTKYSPMEPEATAVVPVWHLKFPDNLAYAASSAARWKFRNLWGVHIIKGGSGLVFFLVPQLTLGSPFSLQSHFLFSGAGRWVSFNSGVEGWFKDLCVVWLCVSVALLPPLLSILFNESSIIMKFSTTFVLITFVASALAVPTSGLYARTKKAAPRPAPKKANWNQRVNKANDVINIASGISNVWSTIKGYV